MIKPSEFFKSAPTLNRPDKTEKVELSAEDEKFINRNVRYDAFSAPALLYSMVDQLQVLSKTKIVNPVEIMCGGGKRGSDQQLARELNKEGVKTAVVHVPGFQEKKSLYNIVRKCLEKINAIPYDLKIRVKDTANLTREFQNQGIKEAGTIVLHLGDIMNSEYIQNPKEFFVFLQDKIARPYNIKIALENIMQDSAKKICQNCGLNIEDYRWAYDPRETIKLLQKYGIDLNLVGLCVDTAHLGASFADEISKKDFSLAQFLRDTQKLINQDNKDPRNSIKLGSVLHNVHLVNVENVDAEEKKGRDDALPVADKNGIFSLEDFGEFLRILQADGYDNGFTLELAPEPMHNKIGKIGLLIGAMRSHINQSIGFKQNDKYVAAAVNYLNDCASQVQAALVACPQTDF